MLRLGIEPAHTAPLRYFWNNTGKFMNKEQLAEVYVSRLKRCLSAVKIMIIVTVAAVAALVIFAVVAAVTGMNESNLAAMLLGFVILGIAAVLCVTGALIALMVARRTMTNLKKLGNTEN